MSGSASRRATCRSSAAGLLLAGGYWDTSSAQVDRLRRAVADDVAGPQLERAVAAVRRQKLDIGGQQLTRVPSGYEKDHPRAELLRYKTLTAAASSAARPGCARRGRKAEIVKAWRAMAPLVTLARHARRPRLSE